MTGCAFPFQHAATVAIWLVIAIASGWLYGRRVAGRVGSDPQKYRTVARRLPLDPNGAPPMAVATPVLRFSAHT